MSDEKLIINSSRERKKERKKLIINIDNQQLNYQSRSRRNYVHRSLAFPNTEESLALLAFMDERARLDGWSFNRLAYETFKEYQAKHPIPNPQATLDRTLTLGMPVTPTWKCCINGCRGKARYQIVLKNFEGKEEVFNVCERHQRWRHRDFKFIVRMKEIR